MNPRYFIFSWCFSMLGGFMMSVVLAVPTPVQDQGAASGGKNFFHTEQSSFGCWQLVDPHGRSFISVGVSVVDYRQDMNCCTPESSYGAGAALKYGNVEAWRKAVARRLMSWGFNTVGGWSDEELAKVDVDGRHLAYTPVLDLGASFVLEKLQRGEVAPLGIFPDVFDPGFAKSVNALAQKRCMAFRDDPNLLGWFTDNELYWGPDWRGQEELLMVFLNLPRHTPGRDAAIKMLRQRDGDIAHFNAIWGTSFRSWSEVGRATKLTPPASYDRLLVYGYRGEVKASADNAPARAFLGDCDAFLGLLSERYFQVTHDAVRAADPNHLVLGCRFSYVPLPPVIAAASRHVDVISCNCYATDPTDALHEYAVANKPVLITEYSFMASDSGLPNTHGAGPRVATQEERALAFEKYVRLALRDSNLVGYDWFQHADEPKAGRLDGENCNYGLVDVHDQPYDVLVRKMTEVNGLAMILHEPQLGVR